MYDDVIVGVDGRSGGRDALALAQELLAQGGHLTLAHVATITAREVAGDSEALLAKERADGAVDAELVTVGAQGVERGLHELAETRGADLLVVGSSSRGLLGRVLLGDDTVGALNGAPCAVAVAPAGYAGRVKSVATVGVAYNGSPESDHALDVARALAAQHGAGVRALEVVSIPAFAYTGGAPLDWGDAIGELIKASRDRLSALEGVEGDAVYGTSGEELSAFGDSVDLLVVGSRGYGPVRRLMLGSTSAFLARHARCPLLIVPRGQ
jgi:nucleotide-binding universal stress UspA family protein